MKYGPLLGWGIVIYAVVTLAGSGLMLYGLSGTLVAFLLQLAVLVIVATVAGRSLRLHVWIDIFPYSFCWAGVAVLLDAMYNMPFLGWTTYDDWKLWVGYGLVLIVPLLAPYTRTGIHGDHGQYS